MQKAEKVEKKLLSSAGRKVFIEDIASSIPTYVMSIFKLLLTLCGDIQSMIARVWWGAKDGEKKIHWVSWEKV